MAIIQAEPPQVHETLARNSFAVYLDVRTEGEFAQGHPAGAINVPVMLIKGPGQMEPNPDFIPVVEKVVPNHTKLVVGCQSGRRSQRACELLEAAGYTDLTNMQGGFGEASYQAQRRKAGL
jgi:rhodanese-related sulfurtransferase